jgi:hypothetical protein
MHFKSELLGKLPCLLLCTLQEQAVAVTHTPE